MPQIIVVELTFFHGHSEVVFFIPLLIHLYTSSFTCVSNQPVIHIHMLRSGHGVEVDGIGCGGGSSRKYFFVVEWY